MLDGAEHQGEAGGSSDATTNGLVLGHLREEPDETHLE